MLTGLLMTVTMLISNMKQEQEGNVVVLYPKAMLRRVLTGNQMLHVHGSTGTRQRLHLIKILYF